MSVLDYFKAISSWPADKVREFLSETDDGAYNLVDVRQPGEYEKGHLPGAVLIPVGELDERVSELDPQKPTIVYCAAGVRSRAAASVLERAGFHEVHSMSGGINAWSGRVTEGFPESGISWFAPAHSPEELTALAWVLEDGTERFYERMMEGAADQEAKGLFGKLVRAEQGHKDMLAALARRSADGAAGADLSAMLAGFPQEKVMEGGMRVDEAVSWAERKGVREILELCISLETCSYDRYQALQRRVTHEKSVELFRSLAAEEKRHLRLLTELFEKRL